MNNTHSNIAVDSATRNLVPRNEKRNQQAKPSEGNYLHRRRFEYELLALGEDEESAALAFTFARLDVGRLEGRQVGFVCDAIVGADLREHLSR
jgi:hypothetical protein